MGWLTLELDSREMHYLPFGESLSEDVAVANADRLEDRLLAGSSRVRRVVLRVLPRWPLTQWILHWQATAGVDLIELDEKLAAGRAKLEDFDAALVCEMRSVTCRWCEAQLRVVMADPTAPILRANVRDRLNSRTYLSSCPGCGGYPPPYVVALIDGTHLVSDGSDNWPAFSRRPKGSPTGD